MIDRRYHRSLQVFSCIACTAMTIKLVLFTDYNSQRGHREREHVFSGIQQYTDKQLDKFFGVEDIKKQAQLDQQSNDALSNSDSDKKE
ncbi:unnamed protein product [Peronospora belbahrii]|uniref:Uncharacterized protein n=1 Tax=Peronospora belbahrii TaxID=622444 RepID=A0AAU9L820_9STRA|nr:unnamed protein product [Peronospora belbahrii]CAH0520678.1 unnamed protein product [Peronospora belbahrii]